MQFAMPSEFSRIQLRPLKSLRSHFNSTREAIMKLMVILLPMFVAFLPCVAWSAESAIIAAGAKLEKLSDGFSCTEGPSVDAEGNVYFTDQPNDRIHKWSTDGKLS